MVQSVKEDYLNQIYMDNSRSVSTRRNYSYHLDIFAQYLKTHYSEFKDKDPLEEINRELINIESYKDEKIFKRKYTRIVKNYKSHLFGIGYTNCSIASILTPMMGFFKYLDCDGIGLNVKYPRSDVVYHNRDITREEIATILSHVGVRERAIFLFIVQGGLRPYTLSLLTYGDIKEDYVKGIIPCKIDIPKSKAKGKYKPYFTFVGREAVNALKDYLATRPSLKDDDLLFVHEDGVKPLNTKSGSNIFSSTVLKLGLTKKGEKGRPKQLRLYCLRKFFRNNAGSAGLDYVHFWMGHKLSYNDEHYFSKTNIDKHRSKYSEVLPNLTIIKQREWNKEIEELRQELDKKDQTIKEMKDIIVTMAKVTHTQVPQEWEAEGEANN